ncbi:MAG: hypothetical protein VX460_04470 [Planctomycetota bacterium]|nr:hypothetical protein [Planctomycetota bacterium]
MLATLCSIDDVGDVLVAAFSGQPLELGGAGSEVPVDGLPPGPRIGLEARESFKEGVSWVLRSDDGGSIELRDGILVDLTRAAGSSSGAAVAARVRRPDPASASLLLELQGATAAGRAARLLLLAPGPGGRVRVSGREGAHFGVHGLTHDVCLQLDGAALRWSCVGGARPAGGEPAPEVLVPLPVSSRLDLVFGAAPDRLAPFGVVLLSSAGRDEG